MKNIIVFYLAMILPFLGMAWWPRIDDAYLFCVLLFVYCFIYRPFIEGLRLYQKKFITKQQFKKAFIPGYLDKIENSFTELYLKR